ncbi:MAG: hypothetical protein HUK28_07030 [Methanobrevibacter sp.]|nr:hypothetical protein [Methanobrevibacter sp.]
MKKIHIALIGVIIIVILCIVVAVNVLPTSTVITVNSYNYTEVNDNVSDLQVKIITNGSWNGSISVDGNSAIYNGTGDKTIDLNGTPIDSVAVAIQNLGTGQLKVQIIKEGKVVKEQSTTDYGVVTITE